MLNYGNSKYNPAKTRRVYRKWEICCSPTVSKIEKEQFIVCCNISINTHIFLHECRNESSNDSHVAVVQSDAIELMILDKRGNVLQDDVLDLDELTVDKSADIQVRN